MRSSSSTSTSSSSTMLFGSLFPSWFSKLKQSIKRNKQERTSSWFQLATVRPNGHPAVRTVVFRGFVYPSISSSILPRDSSTSPSSVPYCTPSLSIITDLRSQKIHDLLQTIKNISTSSTSSRTDDHTTHTPPSELSTYQGPPCEIAWYFPVTREQWRIHGYVSLCTHNHVYNYTIRDTCTTTTIENNDNNNTPTQTIHSLSDHQLQFERAKIWCNMSDAARIQFLWPAPGKTRPRNMIINNSTNESSSSSSSSQSHPLFESEASLTLPGLPCGEQIKRMVQEYEKQFMALSINTVDDSTTDTEGTNNPTSSGLQEIGNQPDPVQKNKESLETDTVASTSIPSSKDRNRTEQVSSSSLYGFDSLDTLNQAIETAYKNFVLLIIQPTDLDYLSLKANPTQQRWQYHAQDNGWREEEVNP